MTAIEVCLEHRRATIANKGHAPEFIHLAEHNIVELEKYFGIPKGTKLPKVFGMKIKSHTYLKYMEGYQPSKWERFMDWLSNK